MRNLEPFFKPRAIAVVGASNNIQVISGKPLVYLKKHGFSGKLYPVNPRYETVQGLPCYPSLEDLPEVPDVAMLIVKAEKIFEQLEACKKKGITHVLVVSSGFAELGEAGAEQQARMVRYAKENGITVIGPNSQGLVSLVCRTALSFSAALERESLILGDIGFISQSGAFGNSVFSLAQDEGIGFAYIACTGNEADVNTFDVMEWMLEDEHVRLIACYNEGFRDAGRLRELSRRSKAKQKPVLWFKSGRSEVGQKAASSHTGSLAGDDAVFDRLLKQYGMLRVNDIHEIFDANEVFRGGRFPRGKKVGILSTSGGTGVMLADELIALGFEVPELSREVQDELAKVLPSFAGLMNPVDVTAQVVAQPELFQLAGEILVRHRAVDLLCISATMIVGDVAEKVSDAIVKLHENTDVPVIVSWTIAEKRIASAAAKLRDNRIPLLKTPVRAARAIGNLMHFAQFLQYDREEAAVPSSAGTSIRDWMSGDRLTEYTLKQAMAKQGLPVTREVLVQTPQEAVLAAEEMGYPVVLKVVSEEIPHKTEVGGVAVGIADQDGLLSAFGEMAERVKRQKPDAVIDGFLIQEMAEPGVEIILGATNKPPYGPVVTVGLGGIWVELLKDVTYRQAPISRQEALAMLGELKGFRLLQGYRGAAPVDVDGLADLIAAFSRWFASLEDVAEMEMNPVIVSPGGVKIVDALCIRKPGVELSKI